MGFEDHPQRSDMVVGDGPGWPLQNDNHGPISFPLSGKEINILSILLEVTGLASESTCLLISVSVQG